MIDIWNGNLTFSLVQSVIIKTWYICKSVLTSQNEVFTFQHLFPTYFADILKPIWYDITQCDLLYLQRVGGLFLSVQWFQGIQKVGVHSEYPLIIPCYHQVTVITWQAMELHGTQFTNHQFLFTQTGYKLYRLLLQPSVIWFQLDLKKRTNCRSTDGKKNILFKKSFIKQFSTPFHSPFF